MAGHLPENRKGTKEADNSDSESLDESILNFEQTTQIKLNKKPKTPEKTTEDGEGEEEEESEYEMDFATGKMVKV